MDVDVRSGRLILAAGRRILLGDQQLWTVKGARLPHLAALVRAVERGLMITSFAGTVLPPARLDPLRFAAAYLARFKDQPRVHTEPIFGPF